MSSIIAHILSCSLYAQIVGISKLVFTLFSTFYALSLHPKRTRPSAALPELCLLGYYKHIK